MLRDSLDEVLVPVPLLIPVVNLVEGENVRGPLVLLDQLTGRMFVTVGGGKLWAVRDT